MGPCPVTPGLGHTWAQSACHKPFLLGLHATYPHLHVTHTPLPPPRSCCCCCCCCRLCCLPPRSSAPSAGRTCRMCWCSTDGQDVQDVLVLYWRAGLAGCAGALLTADGGGGRGRGVGGEGGRGGAHVAGCQCASCGWNAGCACVCVCVCVAGCAWQDVSSTVAAGHGVGHRS